MSTEMRLENCNTTTLCKTFNWLLVKGRKMYTNNMLS